MINHINEHEYMKNHRNVSVSMENHINYMDSHIITLLALVLVVLALSYLLDGSIPTCYYVWHNAFRACEQAKFWAWGEF